VRAFSDDDVGLLVFDLVEEFGELFDCKSKLAVSLMVVGYPRPSAQKMPRDVVLFDAASPSHIP